MNTITDHSHCFLNLSWDISMLTFAIVSIHVMDTEADRNGINFAGIFSSTKEIRNIQVCL